MEIPKYKIIKSLGSGSFGNVFLIEDKKTKKRFALKKIEKVGEKMPREIEILKKLKKTNHCIKLEKVFFTTSPESNLYENLIFPVYDNDLEKLIRESFKSSKKIPKSKIKLLTFQIFKSLTEIHKKKIMHRDIKPENILIKKKKLVLCDFGCSKTIKSNQRSTPHIVSRYYRAPELCLGYPFYTEKIDVWAAGCILLEMIELRPVFKGKSEGDQFLSIQNILGSFDRREKRFFKELLPEFKSEICLFPKLKRKREVFERWGSRFGEKEGFLDFIGQVLRYDFNERVSAEDALGHVFFDDVREEYDLLMSK